MKASHALPRNWDTTQQNTTIRRAPVPILNIWSVTRPALITLNIDASGSLLSVDKGWDPPRSVLSCTGDGGMQPSRWASISLCSYSYADGKSPIRHAIYYSWTACRAARVHCNCQVDMSVKRSLAHGVNMAIYIKGPSLDLTCSRGERGGPTCFFTSSDPGAIYYPASRPAIACGIGTVFPPRLSR